MKPKVNPGYLQGHKGESVQAPNVYPFSGKSPRTQAEELGLGDKDLPVALKLLHSPCFPLESQRF